MELHGKNVNNTAGSRMARKKVASLQILVFNAQDYRKLGLG